MEKVHSKLDLIYGTVQRMSCSTANLLLSHTLSAIQFWFPLPPTIQKKKGGAGGEYVQSTESSSVSDGSSDSGTSSSDDMEASVKKQDKSAKKRRNIPSRNLPNKKTISN